MIAAVSQPAVPDAPEPSPVVPDFDGGWVGAVVGGLAGAREGAAPSWLPSAASDARATVLLVVDGLGWEMLEAHRDVMPALSAFEGGPITTVTPSTTAAALTSITTGVPPGTHGIVGYRFRVGGHVLNTLQWRVPRGVTAPEPAEVQPVVPFGGRPVPVVSRYEFADTGFTVAHLRGSDLRGWVTPGTIAAHTMRAVEEGHGLVYAYWDGLDKVAHAHGLHDEFLRDELGATDRLVAQLLERLPGDIALAVTADHGHVHVEPADHVDLRAELGDLFAGCAGEARFRSLYARSGAARELAAAARERFGDIAWVRTRDEIVADGWLGENPRPTVTGRIGDVVLAAHEPVAFIDPEFTQEARLLGMHGSLTHAEMQVPLKVTRGQASSR
ncbi:PglZ domain-containing protein [Egibacter rhizosphaerae]|uniref:PglZ domain-containing protein n=1 Tax=Egibacter rhizosphaerae TaxID=1670831 RepID=A0A411YJ89_9ACTN|nr:alkaline phosphatase family protein [Egibacter rhizosphaerae]QBI21189.1 PglZ domain-containing protein [Egibacter rhizosphaerae]